MTDNTELTNDPVDNGSADVVSALLLISVAVLGTIHFIYTGGLVAFFSHVF